MKKFLFIFILFLLPNVYALEVNVTNDITSGGSFSPTAGHYQGAEIYNTGTNNWYAVNTRYNGRLSRIRYNLPIPSSLGQCYATNTNYTITMYMATEDWRNHFGSVSVSAYNTDYSSSSVTYVSYKKIYFKFKIPSTETNCIDYVFVDLKSSNLTSTAFTGTSNWNLSKITITDPTITNSGSSGGSATPSPTPTNDYSSIINNQDENTQNIIENNDTNTQNIIENNNSNTDKIIDNMSNPCSNLMNLGDFTLIKGSNRVLDYTLPEILSAGTYTLSYKYFSNLDPTLKLEMYLTPYSENSGNAKTIIIDNSGHVTFTMNSSFNRMYFYILSSDDDLSSVRLENLMLVNGIDVKPYCQYGSKVNKLDDTTSAINNVNDSINNSNIDDQTGFFTGFQDNTHGLTGIITLPLSTIQGLTNSSCVSLSIPIPFTNSNVSLPCMTQVYQTYIPSVYSLWQVVSFGIISYFICLDIFKMVKGFKDPNEDKVEVLDL